VAAQIAPFGASDEVRPEDDLPSISADIASARYTAVNDD
jgi:hypothetical protein